MTEKELLERSKLTAEQEKAWVRAAINKLALARIVRESGFVKIKKPKQKIRKENV